MSLRKLNPTKWRNFSKKIYGFDIETYDDNKKFLMASIYSDNFKKSFYEKRKLIEFFKKPMFKNSYVAATNLQFDFMGTFYKEPEILKFRWLWRGSDLLYAKTYINNGEFTPKFENNIRPVCFIDTLNYVKLGVDDLGKLLNVPKLKSSVKNILGKYPDNMTEWETMRVYNMRDAEISQKIVKFLFEAFNSLGANVKLTVASTAMSLYKNRFLKNTYYRHFPESLTEQFEAYYGGNTHAYCRGSINDYYYYDFNSLYPDVMRNEYPDPNTKRESNKNTIYYIDNFEGVSKVDVSVNYIDYPFLPYKTSSKLIFPYGTFTGWYSHLELREAMKLGYVVKKVYKSIYFKDTCRPFEDYVNELYSLRLKYKKEKSPMELVVKVLMNSLYGKFGQRFTNRDNWMPFNLTKEELYRLDFFERFGEFIRVKKDYTEPSAFCIPVWALYTTAYARIKLYDYIIRSQPVYVDTDSLITKKRFEDSDKIGRLKFVCKITNGIIVKPKFYLINSESKIKGIGVRISKDMFLNFIRNPEITYTKFMKFKESIRRGFIPNEIQSITKVMSLEDDKRLWGESFDLNSFQVSRPLKIIDGVTEIDYEKQRIKAEERYKRQQEKLLEVGSELYEERFSDFFDSMGNDISKDEFFERETDYRNI